MVYFIVIALLMDEFFAEVKKYHPLVGFGHYANFIEKIMYLKSSRKSHSALFIRGLLSWCLAVILPLLLLAACLTVLQQSFPDYVVWSIECIILYFTLGQKSLKQHGLAVAMPLKAGDLKQARFALSMIVSRDTSELNDRQISTATVETITENTHDAIIGPLFFFIVFGPLGAVLFRLSNTLDAMWGYHNEKYEFFGKFAARMDDVLGFISARITVLLMALASLKNIARVCKSVWLTGRQWYSPNAGIVMAAGAGALNVKLGGDAVYGGHKKNRLDLGFGKACTLKTINNSIALMYGCSVLLVGTLLIWQFASEWFF